MMYDIIIQLATQGDWTPPDTSLSDWSKKALSSQKTPLEVTIRLVDTPEITALNTQYRQKSKPTNVLSFPFDMPPESLEDGEIQILGDIVICAKIVNQEAIEQGKSPTAHWAHMVIHGTLHLLGYDHETETDATTMEAIEITLLESMGFPNPYTFSEPL